MHRIIFSIGPVTLYSYGFFVALGAGTAVVMSVRQAGIEGIKKSDMLDIMTSMILGGLVGGRLLFVLINWRSYVSHPAAVFNLSEGGMAFQGALILSLASGFVLSVRRGISFWKVSDILAPYLALAHSIGRIGCFFNGCCYGRPTDCPLSVVFPGEAVRRIPTQLYSSAGLLIIFAILICLRGKKIFDGYLFSIYLMLFAVFRMLMDNFRGDGLVKLNGVTLSQTISVIIFISGVCIYFFRRNFRDREKFSDKGGPGNG
jgi:phosphatidylglycerol---prolipoprotein diacylglyceryl transferase